MNRLDGLDFAFLLKGWDNVDISFDKELFSYILAYYQSIHEASSELIQFCSNHSNK